MKQQRNTTIDFLRIFMSFGVISIHVKLNTQGAESYNKFFSPIAVPFFYLSSLTFLSSNLKVASISDQIKKIYTRIFIPYISWTTIYLFLFLTKGVITGHHQNFVWWRILFYGESAVQLYFLPDLLCLQAMVLGLHLMFKESKKWIGYAVFLLSVGFFVVGDIYNCFGVSASGQYFGIAIYIASAFLLSSKINNFSFSYFLTITGGLLTTFVVCFNFSGYSFTFMEYPLLLPIGGLGVLLFSIGWPDLFRSETVAKIATYSFGIFLSHVVFLEAFEFLTESVLHVNLVYDFWVKTLVVTAIFIVSVIFIYFLRKYSLFKRLLLGE